jgi:hypothetical protein
MKTIRRICSIIQFHLSTVTLIPLMGIFPLWGCSGIIRSYPAVRYVAFGDSTTDGPTDRNYWTLLSLELGEEESAFSNEGRGGESSSDGLHRLKRLLADDLYPNAQVLLYWQGGDDVVEFIQNRDPLLAFSPDDPKFPFSQEWQAELDRIQGNIEQAIRVGHENGLTVYVATYYFLRENLHCKPTVLKILLPSQSENAKIYVVRLNERIRQAARNEQAVVVDVEKYSEKLLGDEANYFDCNHLSAAGNAVIAELFRTVLMAESK